MASRIRAVYLTWDEPISVFWYRLPAPVSTLMPKLGLSILIDSPIKQGEIRKGTLTVGNNGNSDAKAVKVRLTSESLGISIEKSYDKIPPGESREFLFEVNAKDAGNFKLIAYAEYWDDKGNKYVETSEKSIYVKAVTIPKGEEKGIPGFEALTAILTLFVVYTVVRRR